MISEIKALCNQMILKDSTFLLVSSLQFSNLLRVFLLELLEGLGVINQDLISNELLETSSYYFILLIY